MIASVFGELRRRPWTALCVGLLTSVAAQSASPPIARVIPTPSEPRAPSWSIRAPIPSSAPCNMRETLPLADREVVLTFDDGPLPKYSNQILDILAAHCAKATFFLVGRQAQANPEGVRKVRDAGHTVATHSQNHPTGMDRLPLDRSKQEIEQGIASVTAALAVTAPAPFLRIPGLRVNDGIEEFAASKGLQLWSADFPADDWRNVSANRVYELAMQRLEKKGKGILLLHDIQPRTVAALPRILRELKAAATASSTWCRRRRIGRRRRPSRSNGCCTRRRKWWRLRAGRRFRNSLLPALQRSPSRPCPISIGTRPVLAHEPRGAGAAFPCHRWRRGRGKRRCRRPAHWPRCRFRRRAFKLPESARVTLLAASARQAASIAQARSTEVSSAKLAGKSRQHDRAAAARPPASAGETAPMPQGAAATAPKPAAPAKRNGRSVRVAGLKKR